jgi:hypothetical protein
MTLAAADLTEAATNEELDTFATNVDLQPVREPDRGEHIPDEDVLCAVFTPGTGLRETSLR